MTTSLVLNHVATARNLAVELRRADPRLSVTAALVEASRRVGALERDLAARAAPPNYAAFLGAPNAAHRVAAENVAAQLRARDPGLSEVAALVQASREIAAEARRGRP